MMASLQAPPTSSPQPESLRHLGSSSHDSHDNKPTPITPETQAKIDAHHAAESKKHREALNHQADVRRQCEADKASREEKPLTKPGASGPERVGRVYEEQMPPDEQAREEVRKHDSIEAAKAHQLLLKDMETMRVSEQQQRAEIRRKGDDIGRGR